MRRADGEQVRCHCQLRVILGVQERKCPATGRLSEIRPDTGQRPPIGGYVPVAATRSHPNPGPYHARPYRGPYLLRFDRCAIDLSHLLDRHAPAVVQVTVTGSPMT